MTVDGTAAAIVGSGDCASWAEGDGSELALPLYIDGLSDGTAFGMESIVTDFSGPGTYELDKLSGLGTAFTLVVGDNRFIARPDGPAMATLTIDGDGSGSLSVSQFQTDDGAGTYGSPVDADVYWTCVDPS